MSSFLRSTCGHRTVSALHVIMAKAQTTTEKKAPSRYESFMKALDNFGRLEDLEKQLDELIYERATLSANLISLNVWEHCEPVQQVVEKWQVEMFDSFDRVMAKVVASVDKGNSRARRHKRRFSEYLRNGMGKLCDKITSLKLTPGEWTIPTSGPFNV